MFVLLFFFCIFSVFIFFVFNSECGTARKRRFGAQAVVDDNATQPLRKRRKTTDRNDLTLEEALNDNSNNNTNTNKTKRQDGLKTGYVFLNLSFIS